MISQAHKTFKKNNSYSSKTLSKSCIEEFWNNYERKLVSTDFPDLIYNQQDFPWNNSVTTFENWKTYGYKTTSKIVLSVRQTISRKNQIIEIG